MATAWRNHYKGELQQKQREEEISQPSRQKQKLMVVEMGGLGDVSLESGWVSGKAFSKDCVLWPKTFASSWAFYQYSTYGSQLGLHILFF